MSKIQYPASVESLPYRQEYDLSLPPDSFAQVERDLHENQQQGEETIKITPGLNVRLQTALANYFPRSTPFSLLLLHVTQFEYIQMPPDSPLVHKRICRPAPARFLDQVMQPIRRTLRASDPIMADECGSGAAFLFPQVDCMGIERIIERVSRCIHLLQAETVVPPLRQQTEVVLGACTYPLPASSLETLLAQAARVHERITFRPAVLQAPTPARSRVLRRTPPSGTISMERPLQAHARGIPFMQIPSRLPARLKQLVPYALALELRCAPVGRDHNRLTIAMANPADTQALHRLQEVTGMTIFPVSCELTALETLLASKW